MHNHFRLSPRVTPASPNVTPALSGGPSYKPFGQLAQANRRAERSRNPIRFPPHKKPEALTSGFIAIFPARRAQTSITSFSFFAMMSSIWRI